jgi:uncharacterized protein YcbX
MPIEIGQIEAIFRYPVKSMRGEALDAVTLGWHGLERDRRLACRPLDERGGMPWLTGTKLPALMLFTSQRCDGANGEALPGEEPRTSEAADAPAVTVTTLDVRCAMMNIDPDDGSLAPKS